MPADRPRPHTGRRRNEAARRAILDAVADLLAGPGGAAATIDAIAAAAGVGKQTIYRWWPTKGALLLEAMTERAAAQAPVPDTGSLRGDLIAFLRDTFRAAAAEPAAAALRAVLDEALRDADTAAVLDRFTAGRRAVLLGLFERARRRGDLAGRIGADDLGLLVDQTYGLLWYRLLTGSGPLTADAADALAAGLLRQAAG